MKTLTMRVDDSTYQMIKLAADGQKRNISNFIEFATLQYLTSSQEASCRSLWSSLRAFGCRGSTAGCIAVGCVRIFPLSR